MTETGEIAVERRGAVLELMLNRPERKNALNFAMYSRLTEELTQAARDPQVRVVILHGAGGSFTSGNDLQDFARGLNLSPEDSPIVQFMLTLRDFPKPFIAAVTGVAVGIGTTLLLHSDFAYASPASEFRTPFAQLGLCPEYAASLFLPRLVGHRKANEWLMLGKTFNAQQAAEAGVINEVVEDPLATARKVAEQITQMAPAAVRATKALLRQPVADDVRQIMEEEIRVFSERLRSPEFAEAAAAFFEKRAPDFSRFE